MKITVISLLALFLAIPVSAQSLKWPTIVYEASSVADLGTTYRALTHGAQEANPLLTWTEHTPAATVAVGAVLAITEAWLIDHYVGKHHPKIAAVLLYAEAGQKTWIAVHNFSVTPTPPSAGPYVFHVVH